MIIKHRQDVYARRCRWEYAAFYRNVHTWHFSHSSSLSPPIVFVQPEFVLMGQQCNTENFYSSAPHCKILRVVNKGLSNHPAIFIHWIHTNAVDTMACLRHSTPRNTNRMWMADIKYFTRKLEASKIWLNSPLSSFDSSVSGAISLTRVTCAILKHLKQMQTSADASNSQPFLHLLAKFIHQWVERHPQEYHSRNSFGRELCCCSSVLLREQYPIKIKLGIDSISGEHG